VLIRKIFSQSFTVLSGIKLDTAQFIIFFNSEGVHGTKHSRYFSSDIFTVLNCFIYVISIATCTKNVGREIL
jgi:hypothetical protein